ncbi:nuclear transport factor 2 family protein [Streptomyces turgidiscabies]|uniref:nuclear transport factor 2 family protein n=1 Tax=Streptomyces turgidiscabies TaxID=85558 RepID=UPI0038F73083
MTQRVELATVMDRLSLDGLVTAYAVAVDDGDWETYVELFAPDGRADYRSAGGIEGDARQVAGWLRQSMELFPMRQHLIVNRRVGFGILEQDTGDTARVQADYVNPVRLADRDGGGGFEARTRAGTGAGSGSTAPDFVCGGRYAFEVIRTADGWRLREVVVQEKWRRMPTPYKEPVTEPATEPVVTRSAGD